VNKLIIRETKLLGLRIHAVSLEEIMLNIENAINSKNTLIVYGFSANIYSRIRKMPEFIYFFNKMDIVIADGQGIPLLAKMFKVNITDRIGIVNLSNHLLGLANNKGYNVFILGATDEVNFYACNNIKSKYLGIKNCVGRNGYFNEKDENLIVNQIKESHSDILFIGISSPIKERFALKYKTEFDVRIIIPCGGWIDVIAGKVKRPPFLLKKLPITWLFRLIQEPKRMFGPILLTVLDSIFIIFPILYLKHLFGLEKNPSIIRHFKLESKLKKIEVNSQLP
jgi:N-acetylglucosaminyldiphosphoundecaprenol N-acetyl-beta-D-mannosaminyltransferase